MVSSKNNPKSKPRLLTFLLAAFISILTLLSIQEPLTVYADPDYAGWASSLVHSTGSSNQGGTDTIINGVSKNRTGYLCYLLTADGATTGDPAIAFKSPGFSYIDGAVFYGTSRKGHTITGFADATAPWNTTPWGQNGVPTHEPQIKQWFMTMDGNNNRGVQFVFDNWGLQPALKFKSGEYILVIETLMHFQYSKASDSFSDHEIISLADSIITELYGPSGYPKSKLYEDAASWGVPIESMSGNSSQALSALESVRRSLRDAVLDELRATLGGSGRTLMGDPVIGTIPSLLHYRDEINCTSNPFHSYTNRTAPFSEMAIADGVAERAGFHPWTGSTSAEISDQQVYDYAVAMMIITAAPQGQTTYDESQGTTPAPPAQESEGTYTIVKNYRTHNPSTNVYTDDGCFSIENIAPDILIEDEPQYHVVAWEVTTQTSTSIPSINWNPPGTTHQQGDTPTSVQIEAPDRCLYVLLEKSEDIIDAHEEPYNYKLTQSEC